MYLVQVWAKPPISLSTPLVLGSDRSISIRAVRAEFPGLHGSVKSPATLIETKATSLELEADHSEDFARIGRVLARLSFSMLTPFHVICARIVPSGLKEGDKAKEVYFPGPPPGISLHMTKLGFRKSTSLNPAILEGQLAPKIDQAISWFLKGISASNPLEQVTYHWIGLEVLAPLVDGPWYCSKCHQDVTECPHCHAPTKGPKSVRTVRDFLEKQLGVPRAEYSELYRLRCQITHGKLGMDLSGTDVASKNAYRIQQLLLEAIKRELNWPSDGPPNAAPEGITFVGVPALLITDVTVRGPAYYDQPCDSSNDAPSVGRTGR